MLVRVLLLNPDRVFSITGPDILADSIDGETLIINLIDGVYYSSDGVGDMVWRLVVDGYCVGQVVQAVCERYRGDLVAMRESVLAFIEELVANGLITERQGLAAPKALSANSADEMQPFVAPLLQRYTDYQDLLLLDPIHEVVASEGWPVARAGRETQA
jgi:hypothetical protein